MTRAQQSEHRALPMRAGFAYSTYGLRREPGDLPEACARATTRDFRREEGFEHTVQRLRIHSVPAVRKANGDHPSGLPTVFIARADRECPAILHRIPRIGRDIEDRRLEL